MCIYSETKPCMIDTSSPGGQIFNYKMCSVNSRCTQRTAILLLIILLLTMALHANVEDNWTIGKPIADCLPINQDSTGGFSSASSATQYALHSSLLPSPPLHTMAWREGLGMLWRHHAGFSVWLSSIWIEPGFKLEVCGLQPAT